VKRETRLFVEDILDSFVRIEDYTRNLTQEEFFRDSRTQDVVIRRLEIIGEAVKICPRISETGILIFRGDKRRACAMCSFTDTLELMSLASG